MNNNSEPSATADGGACRLSQIQSSCSRRSQVNLVVRRLDEDDFTMKAVLIMIGSLGGLYAAFG